MHTASNARHAAVPVAPRHPVHHIIPAVSAQCVDQLLRPPAVLCGTRNSTQQTTHRTPMRSNRPLLWRRLCLGTYRPEYCQSLFRGHYSLLVRPPPLGTFSHPRCPPHPHVGLRSPRAPQRPRQLHAAHAEGSVRQRRLRFSTRRTPASLRRQNPLGCPGLQFEPKPTSLKIWGRRAAILLASPLIIAALPFIAGRPPPPPSPPPLVLSTVP